MTALGPLLVTSLFAAVSPVLFLAVIAVLVMRGRDPDDRPGPMPYFLNGVALACIIVGVFAAAVTVHSVASLVGPAPNSSVAISSSSSTAIGQSTSGGFTNSFNTGTDNGFSAPETESSVVRNQNVSDSVTAGLFLVVALVGFRLVWPRAIREVADRAGADLALRYAYFVAGLAALALLVLVPLTADNVFRAIAPGVAAAPGHADGVRNLLTFGLVSVLLAVMLRYHLQYATRLRSGPVLPHGDNRPLPEHGESSQ